MFGEKLPCSKVQEEKVTKVPAKKTKRRKKNPERTGKLGSPRNQFQFMEVAQMMQDEEVGKEAKAVDLALLCDKEADQRSKSQKKKEAKEKHTN